MASGLWRPVKTINKTFRKNQKKAFQGIRDQIAGAKVIVLPGDVYNGP